MIMIQQIKIENQLVDILENYVEMKNVWNSLKQHALSIKICSTQYIQFSYIII